MALGHRWPWDQVGGARVDRGTVALRCLGCLPTITSNISGVKDAQRSRRQSIWAVYTSLRHTAKYTGFGCSGDNLHRLLSTRAKLDQYIRANYLLSKTYRTPIERCWVAASLSRGRRLRRHVRAPARSQLVGVALKSCFSSRSSTSARHSEPSCARSPTAALARSQAPSGRTRGGSWRRQAAVGG